jgi:hypothetical protein
MDEDARLPSDEWFAEGEGRLIADKLVRLFLISDSEYDEPDAVPALLAGLGLDPHGVAAKVISALAADVAVSRVSVDDRQGGELARELELLDLLIRDQELLLAEGERRRDS